MTDREKLVELLGAINSAAYIKIPTESGFSITKFGEGYIADYLIANGVTFKSQNGPLRLGEVVALCDSGPHVVYTERRNRDLGDSMNTITPNVGKRSGKGYIITHSNGCRYRLYFRDYGITWRCWAEKPTEEERKAAEWF